MKKVLLSMLAVICMSSLAYAQPGTAFGTIDIFADPALTSCNVTTAAVFPVYIGHTNTAGATASAFHIDHPADFVFLGEVQAQGLKLGSSENGVGLSYNTCLSGTFLILTVQYATQGSPTCGLMTILGDLTHVSQQVAIVNCSEISSRYDQGGQARVNPDGTCQCSVPVQQTTWGGIKALYE